ncbi:hypothetical protein MKW98_022167, partial [Papaver atlanticum]
IDILVNKLISMAWLVMRMMLILLLLRKVFTTFFIKRKENFANWKNRTVIE